MKIGKISLFFIFFIFVSGAYGHVPAEGKIFGSFGLNIHQVSSVKVQDSQSSPAAIDFGILGEGDVSNTGGIEFGIFYSSKTYQRAYGDTHLAERIHKLSVPIGYRYWIIPALSAGIAFDASYSMGEAQVIFNNAPVGSDPTSARSITEYGVDFSTQWEAWSQERFGILFDARYFYSLTAKSGEDANQFSVLIGLKYMIQEKSGTPSE